MVKEETIEKNEEKYNLVFKVDDNAKKKSFDFFALFDVLFKFKWILIISFVICAAVGLAYITFTTGSFYKAEGIIIFNYQGVEKGLDPAGKKLDLGIIRSPYLMSEATKNFDLNKFKVTVDNLRNSLEITPIIPGDVNEKIKQIQDQQKQNIQKTEEYIYYPNRYVISMNISKNWKMTNKNAKDILDSLISKYSDYFYATYSPSTFVANSIKDIMVDDFDYPDVAEILTNQTNLLNSFVTNKSANAPEFRSNSTGLSFDDIFKSVDLLRAVQLDLVNSLVDSYNLTKDKQMRIRIYEYRIKQLSLTQTKKIDEKSVTSEALDRMDKNQQIYYSNNSSTSVNGQNVDLQKIEVVNPEYNNMITKFTDAGVAATNAKHDIEDYQYKISRMQTDAVSADEKSRAVNKVLDTSNFIIDKLKYWIDITNKTTYDYYMAQSMNMAVQSLSPAESSLSINKIKFVIFTLGGGVIGFILVYTFLLMKFISKKRREKNATI